MYINPQCLVAVANNIMNTIKQHAEALVKLENTRLEKINAKRQELLAAYENAVKQDILTKLNTVKSQDIEIYPHEPQQYHTVRVRSTAGHAEFKRYKRCYKPDVVSEYSIIDVLQLLLRHKIITKKQLEKLT